MVTRIFRRFFVHRDVDKTGTTGTGRVAEGVVFSGGKTVICWSNNDSVVVHDSLAEAESIHCHGGATRFVMIDD